MANLTSSTSGYLDPFYADGAHIASAAHFAPDALTLAPPKPHAIVGATAAEPAGNLTLTRPTTGAAASLGLDASVTEMNAALAELFAELSHAPEVHTHAEEKRGTRQVRSWLPARPSAAVVCCIRRVRSCACGEHAHIQELRSKRELRCCGRWM